MTSKRTITILVAGSLMALAAAPAAASPFVAARGAYYGKVTSSRGSIRVKVAVPENGAITIQTMATNARPYVANQYAPSDVRLYRGGRALQIPWHVLAAKKFSTAGSPLNPGWYSDTGYGLKAGTYTVHASFRNVVDGTAAPRGVVDFAVSSNAHP